MSIDLSRKRIIMVHGLAAKPPEAITHDLWRYTLTENIRVDQPQLASDLDAHPEVFKSAYWADSVPHHIPDDPAYYRKLRLQVEKVIAERKKVKDAFHVGRGEAVMGFFKDRGLDLVKLLAGALSIKDDVMRGFLRETDLYDRDQYIADRVRAPLEKALRRAWDDGCEPIVISHSMGTFIAYDVLWRFSHRKPDGFGEYHKRRVKMLVTLGSPLGESAVRDMLFARHHQAGSARRFPRNIDFWHNYACLGDVVSHQKNFDELFYKPMRELKLLSNTKKFRSIDYVDLHNPYEVVSHPGNKGREKRNPHKSYGYLAQPRLGSWVADYLFDRLR